MITISGSVSQRAKTERESFQSVQTTPVADNLNRSDLFQINFINDALYSSAVSRRLIKNASGVVREIYGRYATRKYTTELEQNLFSLPIRIYRRNVLTFIYAPLQSIVYHQKLVFSIWELKLAAGSIFFQTVYNLKTYIYLRS